MIFVSCQEMTQTSMSEIVDVKLLSSSVNADGSWTYKILLPIWEQDFSGQIGLKIDDEDVINLYAASNQLAYYWEFKTPNRHLLLNFGHYQKVQQEQEVWANKKELEFSKYYLNNSLGITFVDGQILPINPVDLTKLAAIIDINPTEIRTGGTVHFSGARSTGQAAPHSNVVTWNWDFGDGESASGANVEHQYYADGAYTVQLTVIDNFGQSNTAKTQVLVYKMSFPPNTMPGGDDYIQANLNRADKTVILYVNLSLTQGTHGKPFWWGTKFGAGTAWVFTPIKPVLLNEDWGSITLPLPDGRQQFAFNYADWYEYLDVGGFPVGVNWSHLSHSRFYDQAKGHLLILISGEKLSRP